MADLKKISELPPSIAASDQDVYPLVQNGSTLKQTLGALRQAIVGGWKAHASNFLSSADTLAARTSIGLGAVNNTSDVNKPVSTAQQAALDLKLTPAQSLAQLQTYGIGSLIPAAQFAPSLDALTLGGVYAFGTTSVGAPGGQTGSVLHLPRDARPTQIASTYSNTKLLVRWYTASGWTTWRELVGTDSPLFTGSLQCSGPIRVGQFTLSTLPSAATFSGHIIDVTNATGGPKTCRSDGATWKILNTTTTVS